MAPLDHAAATEDGQLLLQQVLDGAARDAYRRFAVELARMAFADPADAERAVESGGFVIDGHPFTVVLDEALNAVEVCCRSRQGPPGQHAMERMLQFELAHAGEGVELGIDPATGAATARTVAALHWIDGIERDGACAIAGQLIGVCRHVVEAQEDV